MVAISTVAKKSEKVLLLTRKELKPMTLHWLQVTQLQDGQFIFSLYRLQMLNKLE